MLDLNIFPAEVADKEITYYLTIQNKFGLPLDSRKSYTKADWIIWTATLADTKKDFQQILHPVYVFANETPDRIPLNDWHETTDGKSVGFRPGQWWEGILLNSWLINCRLNRSWTILLTHITRLHNMCAAHVTSKVMLARG